jgi:Ca2+-transporting ATPase
MAFTTLVLEELLRSLGARSETKSLFTMNPRGNLNLFMVVGASILLQVFLHENAAMGRLLNIVPLTAGQWLIMFCLGALPVLVLECYKLFMRIRHKD